MPKSDGFMDAALTEARLAAAQGEVPVGAVLVMDGQIIARSGNLTRTKNDVLLVGEPGVGKTAIADGLALRDRLRQRRLVARLLFANRLVTFDHLGNHLTHLQIVRVNCGDHACVTLFPPSLHHCGTWFEHAMQVHAGLGALDRDAVADAMKAIAVVLERVPRDPFTEAMEMLAPKPQ